MSQRWHRVGCPASSEMTSAACICGYITTPKPATLTPEYDLRPPHDPEQCITTAIASGRLLDLQSEDAVHVIARALNKVKPRIYEAQQGGYWVHGADVATSTERHWVPLSEAILQALRNPLFNEDAAERRFADEKIR